MADSSGAPLPFFTGTLGGWLPIQCQVSSGTPAATTDTVKIATTAGLIFVFLVIRSGT